MKYSRTALRELTRLYRAVLLAAIMGTLAIAGTANAEVIEYNTTVNPATGETLNIGSAGDTVNINTDSDGVLAIKSFVNISGDEVNISTTKGVLGYGALWAQNNTTDSTDPVAKIDVKANTINISAQNAEGVVAMSQGIVNVDGNATITATNAILARGNAQVNINADNDKTTVLNGDITFDYSGETSGSGVDATVNVGLNGADSSWTGNTVVSYDTKPEEEKLAVQNATINLKDGATWNATQIVDNKADTDGRYYTALNNLNVNKGTVNVADATRGIEVENLVASGLTVDGAGMMNVTKTIDTIDDNIDDYSDKVKLADGVEIKGDVNFTEGTADQYAADSGSTVKYKVGNLIGSVGKGEKDIQVVSNGATVDVSEAKWTSENGATFNSTGSADGKMKVVGFAGGIEDATEQSGNVAHTQYEVTSDETIAATTEVKNVFDLKGQGNASGKPEVALNADLTIADGATLSVTDARLTGSAALNNSSDGVLEIKDSYIGVDVNNAGIMYSDPTNYAGTVTNTGVATFDNDTFEGTAQLANSGIANLLNDVTFDAGAEITGAGTTNLVSGTTVFNNTKSSNTINVASGADFSGTLESTGTVNTQNGTIDTITGGVSGGNLMVDASLGATPAVDTFSGGASGATVKSINLTSSEYGTAGSVSLDTGATVDSNVEITGATNYYTKTTVSGTSVVLSDKLMNTSSINALLGTWAAGNYIAASDSYNTTTDSYNGDATAKTVADALSAIDAGMGAKIAVDGNYIKASNTNAINANISALDTAIGDMSGFASQNYAKDTASVAANLTALDTQVKVNADAIGTTADGTYIAAANSIGTNLGALDMAVKTNADAILTKAGLDVANTFSQTNTFGTTIGSQVVINNNGTMTVDGLLTANGGISTTDLTTSGNATVGGALAVTGETTLTGLLTANGGISTTDLTTSGDATVGGDLAVTGDTTFTGKATFGTSGFDFGGNTVDAIDTDGSAVAAGTATTLATAATIKAGAKDADYTATGTNITGTTLGTALDNLDAAIGDRTAYTNEYNITSGDNVAKSLNDLDTAIGDRTYTNGYNIASGDDVSTSLDDLDTIIGDVASVVNTNGNIGGANVAAKLDAIDTNMGDLTNMNHAAFTATPADITSGVNDLATNMATAMGGAFTAGAWTDTVAPAAPNSYAYTASTNVMDAINQVAGNVGTAAQLTTAGTNGVAVANSVNANIDAVNKTIGDITTLNAGTGSTGNAITNGTGIAPTTVVAALNNIDATLGQIHGLKDGNSNLKADSNLANGTTVEDHLVSLDDAIGNRNYASAAYISPGESVADSLSVLDTKLASVHYDLGRLENEVRGGFAAAAAMAALVPNARAAGDTQIAVGTGNYRDRVGFALGAFHYINDNVLINAGAAYGGSKSTTFKAGITFGW